MNNFFWDNNNQLDSLDFIISEQKTYTFNEVFKESDLLYKNTSREIVLILCDRNIETVKAYIGALRNNLIPLLVDFEIKKGALVNILKAYEPKYIVSPSAKKFDEIYPDLIEKKSYGCNTLYTFDVKKKNLNDELALLLLTSGSTGDPKSVRISKQNLSISSENITSYLKLDKNSRSISLLPFHYSYGLSVLHNVIYSRSSLLITKKTVFDKSLWDDCVNHKVTDASGVPFILEIMARLKFPDSFFKNLRCLTQAGGRLDPKITKHFLNLAMEHNFQYFTMYGQTEASPRISYVPSNMGFKKIGSAGIPIDCGEVFIDNIGNKKGKGELIYVGDNVCMGYATNTDELSRGDELKGILKTGDIAEIDQDNFITIIGRKKRFIKLKGISVNLDYVESLMNSKSVKSLIIGKDDKLIIVVEENHKEKYEGIIKTIIKDNFNFHSSLISIKEEKLSNMSSGKPDYKILMDKFL